MTKASETVHSEVLMIVNPEAGNGRAERLLAPLERWAAEHGRARILATDSAAEAVSAAAAAPASAVVVAVGGDGTVNAVVNGLMVRPFGERPTLAVLPAGSGNDFSRLVGASSDPLGAVGRVLGGRPRSIDVGRCNGRWFINAVSIGLDARVVERATGLKATTGRSGLGLYLSAVGPTLLHDLAASDVTISWDGVAGQPARITLIAVANGTTYGGGFKVAPDAVSDDGLLDTVVVDELGLAEAAWRLPAFVAGLHTRMRPVHMERHTSGVIESDSELPAQMDGEVFRAVRFEIAIEPAALTVLQVRGPERAGIGMHEGRPLLGTALRIEPQSPGATSPPS